MTLYLAGTLGQQAPESGSECGDYRPCIIQTAAGLVGVRCVVLPRLPAGGLVPSPNWCPVGLQVLSQVNAVCRCHAQWPCFPSRTDGGGAPEPSAKVTWDSPFPSLPASESR